MFTSLLRRWKSHWRHVTENHNDTSISAFCTVLFRWFIAIATVVAAAAVTVVGGGGVGGVGIFVPCAIIAVTFKLPNVCENIVRVSIHVWVLIRVPLCHHHGATLQKFPDTKMKCRKINTRTTCTNHKHECGEWENYIDKTWQRTSCFATKRVHTHTHAKAIVFEMFRQYWWQKWRIIDMNKKTVTPLTAHNSHAN